MLFGMHPNAEIGNLTSLTGTIFDTVMILSGGGGGDDAEEGADPNAGVKATMADLAERLPENYEMVTIERVADPLTKGETGPYVIVMLQELRRMNLLLSEIRNTLDELDKGMKGLLNMSPMMEDMIIALSIQEWPGRNPFSLCTWEKKAWPSLKKLLPQFADLLNRVDFFLMWTERPEYSTPESTWISATFNPMGFLTAIKQVTARRTGLALDKMTTMTHMTRWMEAKQATYYPENGMFMHGMFMEAARWDMEDSDESPPYTVGEDPPTECFGHITDSRLKELLPLVPVIYCRAIPVQPEWTPDGVGYLMNNPKLYECPAYITNHRGSGVGGTYVFLTNMRTEMPVEKWVLTGACIVFQTND
jgi:dynein heavy chain